MVANLTDNIIENINFIDLQAQQSHIRDNIELSLKKVLDHGMYVNGPEVKEFELELAKFTGAKHVLSCANGTDALSLVLLAKDIKAGDAVFVPSFTFAASAEVIALCGATPIFVDVCPDSFNISISSLKEAINIATQHNLLSKAIIAVDLFGLPADYENLSKIAQEHNLWILADAAQSLGGGISNKKVGTFGLATSTSFFPAKPLGCYGDGGCIFTNDDKLAEDLDCLKSHGQLKSNRSEYVKIGTNSRLDSFQAAILLEKLKVFPAELIHRQKVADCYATYLDSSIRVIKLDDKNKVTSTWAQYTIVLPEHIDRDLLASKLKQEYNIPTAIYYAKPLHRQQAYLEFAKLSPNLPITNKLSKHVLSLPMDGYINLDTVKYISESINMLIRSF